MIAFRRLANCRWKKIKEDNIFSESVAFSIDRQGHLPTVQRFPDRSTTTAALMIIFYEFFLGTFIVLYYAHLDPRWYFRSVFLRIFSCRVTNVTDIIYVCRQLFSTWGCRVTTKCSHIVMSYHRHKTKYCAYNNNVAGSMWLFLGWSISAFPCVLSACNARSYLYACNRPSNLRLSLARTSIRSPSILLPMIYTYNPKKKTPILGVYKRWGEFRKSIACEANYTIALATVVRGRSANFLGWPVDIILLCYRRGGVWKYGTLYSYDQFLVKYASLMYLGGGGVSSNFRRD